MPLPFWKTRPQPRGVLELTKATSRQPSSALRKQRGYLDRELVRGQTQIGDEPPSTIGSLGQVRSELRDHGAARVCLSQSFARLCERALYQRQLCQHWFFRR